MSVCLSACFSAAPTGRIFVKFDAEDFLEMCGEAPNLVKIGQLTWIPKDIYGIDSRKKSYFLARKPCAENPLLHFREKN